MPSKFTDCPACKALPDKPCWRHVAPVETQTVVAERNRLVLQRPGSTLPGAIVSGKVVCAWCVTSFVIEDAHLGVCPRCYTKDADGSVSGPPMPLVIQLQEHLAGTAHRTISAYYQHAAAWCRGELPEVSVQDMVAQSENLLIRALQMLIQLESEGMSHADLWRDQLKEELSLQRNF